MLAVAGIPMGLDERRLGALNIYAATPRTWTPDELAAARVRRHGHQLPPQRRRTRTRGPGAGSTAGGARFAGDDRASQGHGRRHLPHQRGRGLRTAPPPRGEATTPRCARWPKPWSSSACSSSRPRGRPIDSSPQRSPSAPMRLPLGPHGHLSQSKDGEVWGPRVATIRLPPQPGSVRVLRSWVSERLSTAHIEPWPMVLIVAELATNAICHAQTRSRSPCTCDPSGSEPQSPTRPPSRPSSESSSSVPHARSPSPRPRRLAATAYRSSAPSRVGAGSSISRTATRRSGASGIPVRTTTPLARAPGRPDRVCSTNHRGEPVASQQVPCGEAASHSMRSPSCTTASDTLRTVALWLRAWRRSRSKAASTLMP